MRKYSQRIETLLSMIPPHIDSLADIGADHGYFVCEAVSREIVSSAFAVENKKGPYQRLRQEIQKQQLTSRIQVELSDGIASLPSHIPFVTIAGMGGETILDILMEHREKLHAIQFLLIDAHSKLQEVRHQITQLGFRICQEEMVYEDHVYYELILFQKGEANYEEEDDRFGPLLRQKKSLLFQKKWQERLHKLEMILQENMIDEKRKETIYQEIERIQKVL